MEDVRPVRELGSEGEIRVCPDCGYRRGFHVTLLPGDGRGRLAILCCPECGARFDIGWRIRL